MITATINHQDLHKMIDELPSNKKVILLDFVKLLHDEDDEPLSEEDLKALDQADEEEAAGCFYTLEEFNHRMAALQ